MIKQTAVEWLIKEIQTVPLEKRVEKQHLFMHSLKMEREQIIESYCQGCADIMKHNSIFPRETSEQYYNATYKGGEQ